MSDLSLISEGGWWWNSESPKARYLDKDSHSGSATTRFVFLKLQVKLSQPCDVYRYRYNVQCKFTPCHSVNFGYLWAEALIASGTVKLSSTSWPDWFSTSWRLLPSMMDSAMEVTSILLNGWSKKPQTVISLTWNFPASKTVIRVHAFEPTGK